MRRRLVIFAFTVLYSASMSAHASMAVKFVESAPKDWFSFTNNSDCGLMDIKVTVDLSNSVGQLIFDTTGSGAGVEVYQPFEIREGRISLNAGNNVVDGDRMLTLNIEVLNPGDTASFTIDVDDTLPRSELGQTRVSSSEIAQARVSVKVGDSQSTEAVFDETSQARVLLNDCQAA